MEKFEEIVSLINGSQCVLVMADENYIIKFVNEIGAKNYERFGGLAIVGKSLFDCHNENSCEAIKKLYKQFEDKTIRNFIKEVERNGKKKVIVYFPIFNEEKFGGVLELQYFKE